MAKPGQVTIASDKSTNCPINLDFDQTLLTLAA